MTSDYRHQPVMLEETLERLKLRAGSVVVDGTVGGGGHALPILEQIGEAGVLVAFDLDEDALEAARRRLSTGGVLDARVRLVHASFRDMEPVLAELGLQKVDAILLDLGVSSWQLDQQERGFRFSEAESHPAPLDMRMDRSAGTTAAELLRRSSEVEIARWLREYGEVPGADTLARRLVQARREEPIETTADLVQIVRRAGIGRGRKHHPATLVFQALRIAVNDELAALHEGLAAAVRVLAPGGRLVVLSYHSLEDRIVKQRLRAEERGCVCPPRDPVCRCGRTATLRVLTRRPLRPAEAEVRENPRARSARLRAAERLPEAA